MQPTCRARARGANGCVADGGRGRRVPEPVSYRDAILALSVHPRSRMMAQLHAGGRASGGHLPKAQRLRLRMELREEQALLDEESVVAVASDAVGTGIVHLQSEHIGD